MDIQGIIEGEPEKFDPLATSRRYQIAFANVPAKSDRKEQMHYLASLLEDQAQLLKDGEDWRPIAKRLAICAGWLRHVFRPGRR